MSMLSDYLRLVVVVTVGVVETVNRNCYYHFILCFTELQSLRP